MAAVMLADMNKWPEAKKEWIHAATATRWDNLQGPKLEDAEGSLGKICGAKQAWHYSAAYYCRNKDAGFEILSLARKIISQTPRDGRRALNIRFATLANGVLLRDGAKSISEMEMGVRIVEVSSHPPQLAMNTQRGLVLSQKALEREFRGLGMSHELQVADDAFSENESKQHYIEHQDDETANALNFSLGAVATATLPGTMLIVSLVGLAFLGIGRTVDAHAPAGAKFSWLALAIAGSVVGVAVYSITRLPLTALAPLLCFLFLQFTPKVERTKRSSDLGPLFGFTVFVLATTFVCLLAAFLAGFGPASVAGLPFLGVPVDLYGGSSLFLGLAILVLGVLLLITPFWAFAQRTNTPFVLARALQKFGQTVAWGCLALAVLGGPLAIYADSRICLNMEQVSGNEPLYYLSRAAN
jgi:hypothetical protein